MFLDALGTDSERLLNRHNDSPKEFYPYDFVDQLDDSVRTGEFVYEDAKLPEEVKSSLYVNLLTEEGLPYYTSVIERDLPKGHAFREWVYSWTAEEGRHGPAISNWMHKIKQFDMYILEQARMAMMKFPQTPQPGSIIEAIVYPAFQEPATEVSHRNTMKLLPKVHKIGRSMLGSVIGDEVKHGLYYRDLTTAALEVSPSITIQAIAAQIKGFAMPGKSIPGFKIHKEIIENANIFGAVHLKKIYDDLTGKEWKIWDKVNLTPDGEKAREYLADYLERLQNIINRREERKVASA